MNAIVVVDQNWGIGQQGQLLFHLPADLKRFRQLTVGSIVLMGCNTLQSLPGGRPLPDRENVVLTSKNLDLSGATILHTPAQALELLCDRENVFVIGGGSVYASFLPYCQRAYVTRVDAAAPGADTFFPNLDKLPNWEIEGVSEPMKDNDLTFRFYDYVNRNL